MDQKSEFDRLGIVRLPVREALLSADPCIAALCSRNEGVDRVRAYMAEHVSSGGTTLQVIELTGEPGDIVLMDVRLLQASAPKLLQGSTSHGPAANLPGAVGVEGWDSEAI